MIEHMSLRDLYALAYLDGLARKTAQRPAPGPSARIPAEDTGRAPTVPLPRTGGDRG